MEGSIDYVAIVLCEKLKIKDDEDFNKWANLESIKSLVSNLKLYNCITYDERLAVIFLDRLKDLRRLKLSEIARRCANDAMRNWNGNYTGSGSVANSYVSVKRGKEMDPSSLQHHQNNLSQHRGAGGWSTSND